MLFTIFKEPLTMVMPLSTLTNTQSEILNKPRKMKLSIALSMEINEDLVIIEYDDCKMS